MMVADPAYAGDRRIRIVNNTIDPIIEFYALPGKIRGWDDARNLLPLPIRPGQRGEIVINGTCRLNLLAVFADGTEAARWELNLCKRTEVTFYD